MTLKIECLEHCPLTEGQVEHLFPIYPGSTRPSLLAMVRLLCLSHERLRAELSGAEILLKESESIQKCPECNGTGRMLVAVADTKIDCPSCRATRAKQSIK